MMEDPLFLVVTMLLCGYVLGMGVGRVIGRAEKMAELWSRIREIE